MSTTPTVMGRGQVRSPLPRRGRIAWLAAVLVLCAIAVALYSHTSPAQTPVKPASENSPKAAGQPIFVMAPLPADIRAKMCGRWQRPDGGYVLTIQDVAEDGMVTATYANPQPIHIARAQAMTKNGTTSLYVELRDRNYPGNYYTLDFDPVRDQFAGVYYHLGIQQKMEVQFERLK
jgi:hypothetical protein